MPLTANHQQNKPRKKGNSLGGILAIVGFLLYQALKTLPHFGHLILSLFRGSKFTVPSLGSVNLIPWIIGGLFALSLATSLVRRVARTRTSNDSTLPTTYTPSSSQTPDLPSWIDSSSSTQQPNILGSANVGLPQAPRYESAFNGRAFLASLVFGAILFGGLFLLRALHIL